MEKLGEFGIWYAVFLLTLTLHEAAHALVAWLGGDDVAYRGGQVSLNPLPHIQREPVGTILFPIFTFAMSGWMMGWASTPFDPAWGERHPRRMAAMSAAGPAANLVLAIAAFAVVRGLLAAGLFAVPEAIGFGRLIEPIAGTPEGSMAHPIAFCLSVALNLNFLLFLFNLLPLPPLDGAGILSGLFPDTVGAALKRLGANPMMGILGLFLAWQVFGLVYAPAFRLLVGLLYSGVAFG